MVDIGLANLVQAYVVAGTRLLGCAIRVKYMSGTYVPHICAGREENLQVLYVKMWGGTACCLGFGIPCNGRRGDDAAFNCYLYTYIPNMNYCLFSPFFRTKSLQSSFVTKVNKR